ncbi:hypothetical protein H310_03044 [Aphanomyces invadans]|uniref:Glycoside hydrolase n=1 Tax=Aphanomyces invadans TaxID=157072 RepID=A0A024UMW9_9STRA|nr:hypothetical protein H310_03044 [Aphanomyces invadans]ETW06933.1 hypothetical protein H310_03044 [Aphanomyces invadans]|eukprot:XP_008865008.1 hypothetical protein H310_03044 [Aphanomyces invadans]
MLRSFTAAIFAIGLSLTASPASASVGLCATNKPYSYSVAKTQYPHLKSAIEAVEAQPIATWYTDRSQDAKTQVQNVVSKCPAGDRPTVVVYGLPNKDCEGHHSSDGSNKSTADYAAFLESLVAAVGNNDVIYILEPDAIGLLAGGSECAVTNGYEANLIVALGILGKNPRADIYVDVGYWVLGGQSDAKIAAVLAKLDPTGKRLKGISINTSNFRSTDELVRLCSTFSATAKKTTGLAATCVLDISRNFQGPDPNSQWCNPKGRGIGRPPAVHPAAYPLIDYFLWIKPPGESDGTCNGGPNAGAFFAEGFVDLWNKGYFVSVEGQPQINITTA